ncbi:MAG: hypothetical protein CVU56_29470, partial [Deltaproteobacteria bacterium HGW-Deltaproteobacteria-14]
AAAVGAGQAAPDGLAAAAADARRWRPAELRPPPLLDGRDLAAAGYAPGPAFKRILDAVEDAQLEDRARTRDEALAVAAEVAAD